LTKLCPGNTLHSRIGGKGDEENEGEEMATNAVAFRFTWECRQNICDVIRGLVSTWGAPGSTRIKPGRPADKNVSASNKHQCAGDQLGSALDYCTTEGEKQHLLWEFGWRTWEL
jgi:hypothetical protein